MIIELLRLIILSTSIFFEDISRFLFLPQISMRCKASNHLMYFIWLMQEKQFSHILLFCKSFFPKLVFHWVITYITFFIIFKVFVCGLQSEKIFILKLKSNTFDFPSLLLSIDFFSFVTFFSSSFSCCTEAARHGTHVMHLDRIAC